MGKFIELTETVSLRKHLFNTAFIVKVAPLPGCCKVYFDPKDPSVSVMVEESYDEVKKMLMEGKA